MKTKQGIGEVLLSNESALILFWSAEDGWQQAGEYCPLDEREIKEEDGLQGLRADVEEDDLKLFDTFCEKLESGMEGADPYVPVTDCILETTLRMRKQVDEYGYYKVECDMQKDEEGRIKKAVVRVLELASEEVYRHHLMQEYTDERESTCFAQSVCEVVERNPERKYALIQFDVTKFKMINEQYGEAFGDEVLEYFIYTLRLVCNREQLFTRMNSDVFNILTPYESKEELLEFVDTIRKRLLGYKGISYRLVFGICPIEGTGKELRRYSDSAAFARQSIKGDALTYVAFYKDDMKKSIRMNQFIEDHMEQALENHEFVMYLQPKYCISKDRMIGAEALVRWIHPEKGVISPAEFVPLFEKNGFIIKMDQYIWEEACIAIRRWMNDGFEPIPISVNVSRRHLMDDSFIKVLNRLTDKYLVPKKYLEIEITESIENEDVGRSVRLLKEEGYTLLMDDFGTGYSSLNMLKDTQFDIIKIDRGFLQDFISSERGRSIVEHTIHMAKAIGLDMIAEGVETREEADFLSKCGCDMAQGFYYAKPIPIEEFNHKYRT